MSHHGAGPKYVFVRKYRRWRYGRLESVRDGLRGLWHPDCLRRSTDQLNFWPYWDELGHGPDRRRRR